MIVVLLPDSGRGYLTKVFNDEWLAQYGFPVERRRRATRQTVGEVLRGKDGRLPDLVHTHPGETIAEAVAHPAGVRRLADARRPRRAADRGRRGGRARSPSGPCSTRCSPARPGSPTRSRSTCRRRCRRSARPRPARDAVTLLEGADAVLVQEDGKPVGVLTRQDLLAFLARG